MPGEIIRINCACGVNGSISLGFSEAELFLRLRESDALPKTVFEYITIDKNLELVTLQSSVRFLPFSDYLIPIESLNGLISGRSDFRCPRCQEGWSVVGVINFD